MSQLGILFTISEPGYDLGTSYFVAKDFLPVVEESAPEIEVLLPPHVVYIAVDEAVALVVLVNDVESFAIPQS